MKERSRLPLPGGSRQLVSPTHGKVRRLLVALLALLALVTTLIGSGATRIPTARAVCSNICYEGGPVQDHPRVYLLFWGPRWTDTTDQHYATYTGIVNKMTDLFNGLAGGSYNNIIAQYTGNRAASANYLHTDSVLADVKFDTTTMPTFLDLSGVAGEASRATVRFGWPQGGTYGDPNTQVLVFPQEGMNYMEDPATFPFGQDLRDSCGAHWYTTAPSYSFAVHYGVVRYAGDLDATFSCKGWGTSTPSTADAMTVAASSVYAGIATNANPQQPAWRTWDHREIGEKCATDHWVVSYQPAYGPSSAVWLQQLYSNLDYGCIEGHGTQYSTLVHPYQHTVQGNILSKYASGTCTGAACTSRLGAPVTEEIPLSPNGTTGAVSRFAGSCGAAYGPNGSCSAIYDGPYGVYANWGADYYEYESMGGPGGLLGFPKTDPIFFSGGAVSYFRGWGALCNAGGASGGPYSSGGAIYSQSGATFAHEVHGCIEAYYENALSGPIGSTGWPVADEEAAGSGRVSYFNYLTSAGPGPYGSSAAIYFSTATGAHQMHGGIYTHYVTAFSGPDYLGLPVADEEAAGPGRASYLNTGGVGPHSSSAAVYWSSTTGAWSMRGGIYTHYVTAFGPSSGLGLPISDEEAAGPAARGGRANYFLPGGSGPHGSRGAIYWTSATGAQQVWGSIYAKYLSLQGPNGWLGFPITDEFAVTGGRRSNFENGYIVWDSATNTASAYSYSGGGCLALAYAGRGGAIIPC